MVKSIIWVLICFSILIMAGSAEKVNVVDFTGCSLSMDAPVLRVVSLGTGVAGYIYALDGGQSLVGRDSYSYFPPDLQKTAIAGKSSYSPDLELIMKLHPNLVIADSMLSEENRKKLENAGIPVMMEWITDPAKGTKVMEDLGLVMGKEERAQELIGFIKKYQDLIQERTAGLKQEDMPKVFFEWTGKPYYTVSNGSSSDTLIGLAGGINIAKDLGNGSHTFLTVSPEWVIKVDPDVIIQTKASDKPYNENDLKGFRETILSRPELQDVKAIKTGRVYVISGEITYGIRSIISELYMAKWFHPEQFKDIDPEAVHRELVEKFYGLNLEEGAYVYPSSS
ncbi:MAG: ABC transporter substrate-binding protein [Methanothrix sp.]